MDQSAMNEPDEPGSPSESTNPITPGAGAGAGVRARAGAPIDQNAPPHIEVMAADGLDCDSIDLLWIQSNLKEATRLLNQPIERLTIQVIEDEAMAKLHGQFGGPATPTDVLTFPMHDNTQE